MIFVICIAALSLILWMLRRRKREAILTDRIKKAMPLFALARMEYGETVAFMKIACAHESFDQLITQWESSGLRGEELRHFILYTILREEGDENHPWNPAAGGAAVDL